MPTTPPTPPGDWKRSRPCGGDEATSTPAAAKRQGTIFADATGSRRRGQRKGIVGEYKDSVSTRTTLSYLQPSPDPLPRIPDMEAGGARRPGKIVEHVESTLVGSFYCHRVTLRAR